FPTFFAVVCLDLCHALERRFGAHFVGPLLILEISQLDLALLHQHLAAKAQGLESMQRFRATLGLDILGNQLIHHRLILVLSESRRDDERSRDKRNYETRIHTKFAGPIRESAPIGKGDAKASCSATS